MNRYCAYCGSRPAVNADHVVPKALRKTLREKYGSLPEELRGTVPACMACNVRKGTRKLVPPSWADYIPILKEFIPGQWRVWDGNPMSASYRGTFA